MSPPGQSAHKILSQSDEEGYYFIEQLDNVPVQLISAKYHDEDDAGKG